MPFKYSLGVDLLPPKRTMAGWRRSFAAKRRITQPMPPSSSVVLQNARAFRSARMSEMLSLGSV